MLWKEHRLCKPWEISDMGGGERFLDNWVVPVFHLIKICSLFLSCRGERNRWLVYQKIIYSVRISQKNYFIILLYAHALFSFSSPQFHGRKQRLRILPKAKIWQVIFGVSVLLPLRISCKWAGWNKHAGDLQVVVWFIVQLQH